MHNLNFLTQREKEILELVCQGFSNTEIAQKLFISTHTVKFYVLSTLRKFNTRNRTTLAYIVGKYNLADINPFLQ